MSSSITKCLFRIGHRIVWQLNRMSLCNSRFYAHFGVCHNSNRITASMQKHPILDCLIVFGAMVAVLMPAGLLADDLLLAKECRADATTMQFSCDVRLSRAVPIKFSTATISQAIIPSAYTYYSQSTRRNTLISILMDTSDPRRRAIVEKKIQSVASILKSANENTQIGLAVFDAGLREIQSFTNNAALIEQALENIQPAGAITELYRSAKQALEHIQEKPADRRFLIILSDGKAEDTSYSLEDVIQASGSVGIISLGYPGSQTGRINLQAMRRLSEDTNGIYLEANLESLISTPTLVNIIPTLESGGVVNVDLTRGYFPGDIITITLQTHRNERIEFQTTPTLSVFDYLKFELLSQWKILSALAGGLLLIAFLWWLLRAIKSARAAQRVLAKIELLDSKRRWHKIKTKKISIGRNQENDLVLSNNTVSDRHAVIQMNRDNKWVIVDMDSTNGVAVNGKLEKSAMLDDKAIVEIGSARFRFHYNVK